jgi:hypothetical protein
MKGKNTREADTTDTDGWQCIGPYEFVHRRVGPSPITSSERNPCGYCETRAPSTEISIPPKTLDAGMPNCQVLPQRNHETVDTTA